jgi:uncharacterized membrane protein YgdD (TMEM256/DUF423 family)
MSKLFLFAGSILAFFAVALGAFGAHSLKPELTSELFATFQTAVNYHTVHALAILVVGVVSNWIKNSSLLKWSGLFLIFGIILFSGSLYLLSVTGLRWLGIITPTGGLCFLIGWLFLAIAAFRNG